MSKLAVGLSAVALLATGALNSESASAAPLALGRDAVNTVTSSVVDNVDYLFEGHNYCWYYDGWHGPGWYYCGYSWRRGYGWGSPEWGWRGWAWGGPRYGRGWHGRDGGRGGHGGGGHGGHDGHHH